MIAYTTPQDPASALNGTGYTNSNTTVKNKVSIYQIPIGYAAFLPPLIGGNKKNQFIVTGDAFVNLAAAEYSTVTATAIFSHATGSWAPSTAHDNEVTRSFDLGASFKIGAGAIHSLYFTPAPGVEYGIVPAVYVDYARLTNGAPLKSQTTVDKTDVNANGNFTTVNDFTTTTTITYAGVLSDGVTALTTTDQVEVFISVPMVLKITPQGWIFGFTIATTPQAFYQYQGTSTASITQSQTATTVIVGGATTTTTSTSAVTPAGPGFTVNHTWTFQAIHTLGLNFVFFDKVLLDVLLNFKSLANGIGGQTSLSSLFDFNNLTIQATVPLS